MAGISGSRGSPPVKTVDDYLESFSPDVRAVLGSLREAVRRTLPDAEETISYGIPAYRVDGADLVYFAGWKHHTSLYPIPDVSEAMEKALTPYRAGKGTLRFPLGEPVPIDLVERVVQLLARQRRAGQPPGSSPGSP